MPRPKKNKAVLLGLFERPVGPTPRPGEGVNRAYMSKYNDAQRAAAGIPPCPRCGGHYKGTHYLDAKNKIHCLPK